MLVKGKPDALGDDYDTDNYMRPPVPVEKIEYLEPEPQFYVMAIDLGNVSDSTAISIVEVWKGWERLMAYPWNAPPYQLKKEVDVHFLVRHLHRPRLGIGYDKIIEQLKSFLEDLPPLPKKPVIVFDATGLGAPVVQYARKQRGLERSIGLSITAGQVANLTGIDWNVPKEVLVGSLRLAMQRNRVKIAQGFQAREVLQRELEMFHAKLSPSGRATFAAAGSEHDDTVLSLSMAVVAGKQKVGYAIGPIQLIGF